MLKVVRRHSDALKAVREAALESDPDSERCELIRSIRSLHADRRIAAFSQYADTIEGLFTRLSRDGQVAALSGSGARVSGGRISRSEALASFAPVASRCSAARPADDITLLLTTDLLSEGVNLQDAGVVVHLDLPWTPARMEQRLGRIVRIGSSHGHVESYGIEPPVSAEAIVRIEEILRRKLTEAGCITALFPSLSKWTEPGSLESSDPATNEAAREILECWKLTATSTPAVAAAVWSGVEGFLAVATVDERIRVIAKVGDKISESPRTILECLTHCSGVEVEVEQTTVAKTAHVALSWLNADNAMRATGVARRFNNHSRLTGVRRINRMMRRARAHHRARISEKCERALAVLTGNLGAHDETEILSTCRQIEDDEAFLDRILSHERRTPTNSKPARIIAMIVLSK
jgi:hypothetical protein